MNTNHSSFLKMIGLEAEGEEMTAAEGEEVVVAEGEEAAKEGGDEVASPEEQAPQDDFSSTRSETEWDSDRMSAKESTELENFESEVLTNPAIEDVDAASFEDQDTRVENSESSDLTEPENVQRQSVFTHSRRLENLKTNLSKISIFSRLSRIVSRSSRVEQTKPLETQNIDYENAQTRIGQKEAEGIAEDSLNSQALNEVNELDQNSELNELMKEVGQNTRKTVPFDYDAQPANEDFNRQSMTAGSASGTAHFDYDEVSGVARVVVLEGRVSAKAFHLNQLPLRIGRDPLNEIVIDDTNVSRYHAEIRQGNDQSSGQIVVADIGSTNGIKINGQLVTEAALQSHDILQVGEALFEFLDPGVLSKGVMQSAAIEAATPIKPKRSKKLLIATALVILGVGAYLFTSNDQSIRERAVNESKRLMAAKMESEVTDLKAEIEKAGGKPIAELNAEEVKKSFLTKVDQSMLVSLLPADLRQRMTMVPAEILRVLIEDPKILPQIVASGANLEVLQSILRSKLNDLAQAGRFADALAIVDFLYASNPKDEKLKKWKAQLEERVTKDSSAEVESASKTDQILKAYESNFEVLLERGRVKDALEFAKKVRSNALDSIKKFPQFAERAKAEAAAWGERVTRAEAAIEDYQKAAASNEEAEKEGETLFQDINSEMDFANITEAKKLIDEFIKKYPLHTKVGEVMRLKKQLEEQMGGAFSSTKQSIEMLIKAESYDNAWTELYRFLDQAPEHPQALDLKMALDKATAPRATQFYNQGRVFEFEADDLVAAEQYYKKTLDSADPRGELYKKAQRRYADVKRKSIH